MPTPPNIPANITWVLGFSSPSQFFVGYYNPSDAGANYYPMAGLGWNMTDTPTFNTLDSKSAGGRSVMNSLYQNPLHQFKLTFNFLENQSAYNYSGNPDTDYRMLYSFYCQQKGKFGEFLYQPRESAVVHQPLALPDTNGYVELIYNLGPFSAESVQELNNVLPTIYMYNGSTYTNVTGTCTFYAAGSIAPYPGIVFTSTTTLSGDESFVASYNFFYRCQFDKDNYSFEEFMYALMKVGVGLSQVRI
jgi:Conserved hypothetical protein 2217 (DUF2460)